MTPVEIEGPKGLMRDLLARIDSVRESRSVETKVESGSEQKARLEQEADIERAHAESRRIAWLNEYYRRTPVHGLPLSADAATLDSLDTSGPDSEAYELIKAWRVGDPFGLFIIGPTGCGKSFALQALAKHILFGDRTFSQKRQSMKWFPVAGGLDQIRREMNDNFDETKQAALTSDYVFFDDLGVENLTDWAREQIYQIFEHRLNYGLTTFISSNCTVDELKSRYHERFISRIKEGCAFVQLKGRDRRNDKMKENLATLRGRARGATEAR